MNYSHKHKFVWHCPSKVASRATADFFREYSDLNPHLPTEDNPSMIFTHENMWPEVCSRDYLHIVNVRHPYYRWISYWKHDRVDSTELDSGTLNPLDALYKFPIERCDALSQWRIITQFESRIDHIIHAESVLTDLKRLPFISDELDYKFTTTQMRPTKIPPSTIWDEEELRELVYIRFKQDYDNLGYGKLDNYDHLWDAVPNPIKTYNSPTNPTRSTKTFPTKL